MYLANREFLRSLGASNCLSQWFKEYATGLCPVNIIISAESSIKAIRDTSK